MKIRETRGDRAFMLVNFSVLTIFTLSVLYPLLFVLSASLSSSEAVANNQVFLWPVGFSDIGYQAIWSSPDMLLSFGNSLFYAVSGAVIGTLLTVLAGYSASRTDLPFRRGIMFFFIIPTLIAAGMVPNYMVVKTLGLLDTRWAIILPTAMSMFNVIITRTFYQMNVPSELMEAARVDGASDFSTFFRIAVPLSKPIIAVNLLFYALGQWNSWFTAMLYTSNPHIAPIQLLLREILAQSQVDPSTVGGDTASIVASQELFDKLKYAVIVVAMAPPLIIYPFVQKHFVKGALIGSLK